MQWLNTGKERDKKEFRNMERPGEPEGEQRTCGSRRRLQKLKIGRMGER